MLLPKDTDLIHKYFMGETSTEEETQIQERAKYLPFKQQMEDYRLYLLALEEAEFVFLDEEDFFVENPLVTIKKSPQNNTPNNQTHHNNQNTNQTHTNFKKNTKLNLFSIAVSVLVLLMCGVAVWYFWNKENPKDKEKNIVNKNNILKQKEPKKNTPEPENNPQSNTTTQNSTQKNTKHTPPQYQENPMIDEAINDFIKLNQCEILTQIQYLNNKIPNVSMPEVFVYSPTITQQVFKIENITEIQKMEILAKDFETMQATFGKNQATRNIYENSELFSPLNYKKQPKEDFMPIFQQKQRKIFEKIYSHNSRKISNWADKNKSLLETLNQEFASSIIPALDQTISQAPKNIKFQINSLNPKYQNQKVDFLIFDEKGNNIFTQKNVNANLYNLNTNQIRFLHNNNNVQTPYYWVISVKNKILVFAYFFVE